MSSPTFRRAFSFAVFLHVMVLLLVVAGVKFWPKFQKKSIPAGMVLDVTEPFSAESDEAPSNIKQVLALIPSESRIFPDPEVTPKRSDPPTAIMVEPLLAPPGGVPVRETEALMIPELDSPIQEEKRGSPSVANPTKAAIAKEAKPVSGEARGGRPVVLSEIVPHYPYGARVRGEFGRVTVNIHVSEKGVVESASVFVSSGHPVLDDSALTAAKKARFKPAERGSKPVASEMNLQFEFRLEDRQE